MKSKFMNDLDKYINDFLPNISGSSHNTIRSYKFTFRLLLEFFMSVKDIKPNKIDYDIFSVDILTEYLEWLEVNRGCSVSTRNQRLAALSSFGKYAQTHSMEGLSFSSMVYQIPRKKCGVKNISFFTAKELKILLGLPNSKYDIGARDKALMSFMYATGARAQEVCDVKVSDILFQSDGGAIVILTGKGNKKRRVAIPKQCVELMKKYLKRFNLEHERDRYVFFSQTHQHMTISCIEEIYKKYLKKAKENNPTLFKESYSPHSMRHTTATHMLQAGVPLIVIKNFLGHVSVNTTQIYAEVTQQTVNDYVIKWNEEIKLDKTIKKKENQIPDFLSN